MIKNTCPGEAGVEVVEDPPQPARTKAKAITGSMSLIIAVILTPCSFARWATLYLERRGPRLYLRSSLPQRRLNCTDYRYSFPYIAASVYLLHVVQGT